MKKHEALFLKPSQAILMFDDPIIDAATIPSDFDLRKLRRSLKLLREYCVRCVLTVQYIAQTYEQYTHDEAKAFTNIKTKIAFATEDIHDAEFVSKLLGTKTVRVDTGSISNQSQGYSKSKNYTYQALPLLRPDEVMRLPQHQSLIIRTGHAPLKAEQFIWYQAQSMKHLPCGRLKYLYK